ncbi:hypothetical protein H6F74_11825 [Trichocoleus sp. FACHB-90]|uniref:SNF2-related protein n=1 Tax=Cyanophyceae TaxID=3028117 RepID=UPI00168759F6|nr:SNF2-related protein [Trichocoleus sp. FACHB-90]MBD1926932.1 hypothetical protein [Trichocoleus sp. FACHB-90]
MDSKRKPNGYWNDFANLERELLAFIEEHGTPGIMPTNSQLLCAKRSNLARAIHNHGGLPAVAKRLGLELAYTAKPFGYWDDFANVKREIVTFTQNVGTLGVMPTKQELTNAGRSDLASVIHKHGGYLEVAKRLGLNLCYRRKLVGYWEDFSNMECEIFSFIQESGTVGIMPTHEELLKAGRNDLAGAIQKHGGYPEVAKSLGLKLGYTRKLIGYWEDFSNVKREILAFIQESGTLGVMPTHEELMKAGRTGLASVVQKHGGWQSVAERLGLTYAKKRSGYWEDFLSVEREVFAFIEKFGTFGVMPTGDELREAGRSDLENAMRKHGGFSIVAERLGLTYAKKQHGYWKDFSNVEREVFAFIQEFGTVGVMPTNRELLQSGQSALAGAIQQHGGCLAVAHCLNLIYSSLERITPRTAADVEKTARAIQPLAESDLLSGAQVMVILRRAGLLEYRNQRVVKLNASLARGKHEEIESAITQLASTREELATEPIKIEENEDISTAEVEALVSSGLETSENPPLVKSTSTATEPDTQREQAVIRGLSALGELRLPLDEVLTLLTSKLLWQAFYKRLYNWYGGLDAAQNVTAEDVEAAILRTYPEHRDNEFVAEAAAQFTLEVEQAVNFAASLADDGWHGFRLRLHQADAARRMAEVLSNKDDDYPFLLNGDDPGMGKSASFLAAVCASGTSSVVLIAPKTVADDTWCSKNGEIRRCLPHADIVRGLEQALTASPSSRLTFYVLHYEELLKSEAVAALAEQSFDCLCLDEIHFIKQRAEQGSSQRRVTLQTLRNSAGAAIGLTGTPLINELAEPMSLLQTLSNDAPQFDHSRLSSRRLSDIADVFEALLPHIIRRRKPEVLLHLPSCDLLEVDIPVMGAIALQMLDIHKWSKSRATQQLIELRKLATDAKLAYLQQQVQKARKLLILTYLTDDVSDKITAYLEEFLPNQVAHINGQTPKEERQKRLDSFRKSDDMRVLVGTIGTIGTGLTLFDPDSENTANEIIIADLPPHSAL